jgi:hypothetical protein
MNGFLLFSLVLSGHGFLKFSHGVFGCEERAGEGGENDTGAHRAILH